MKISRMTVISAAAAFLALCASTAFGQYSLYVQAVPGPDKSDPVFPAWASNVVSGIFSSNRAQGCYGYRMATNAVTWDMSPGATNCRTWFTVHVVADDIKIKLDPFSLYFNAKSADGTNNALGHGLAAATDPLTIFTPYAMGVNWASGSNHRSNCQVVTSGLWSQTPVNEFIFIGAATKYFICGTNGWTRSMIAGYLDTYPDFRLTGSWSVTNGLTVISSAQKTLYWKGSPAAAKLSIRRYDNMVSVSVSCGTNDSWIVRSSSSLKSQVWLDEAAISDQGVILRHRQSASRFFSLIGL